MEKKFVSKSKRRKVSSEPELTEEDVAPLRERVTQQLVTALVSKAQPAAEKGKKEQCVAPGCKKSVVENALCGEHDGTATDEEAAILKATAQLLATAIEEAGKALYDPIEQAKKYVAKMPSPTSSLFSLRLYTCCLLS